MRILHIVGTIDPKAGGVSEAIRALILYSPPDYKHEIVSMDDPAAPFLAKIPAPTHAFGPTSTAFAYSPKLRPWLIANRDRFDGVFVHGLWVYCGVAAWQTLAGRIPYVVFPHGMLDPYFKRAFPRKHLKKWLYWLAAQFWVLRGADKVLFTCSVEAELAKKSFWLHRWNPCVVAFGATGPSGDAAIHAFQKKALLARFPGFGSRRFLLFLGRIDPRRAVTFSLQLSSRLPASSRTSIL